MVHKRVNGQEVATGIGVHQTQISKWLKSGSINKSGLERLSVYFEIPVSEFVKLGE